MEDNYLVTTSDYYPQVGGLTTFCSNIEKSLKRQEINYTLLHWKSYQCFKNIQNKDYTKIIHVHPWGSFYSSLFSNNHTPYVNFYHGSEILFCGTSALKKTIKKMIKPWVVRTFEKADKNIFISEFTFNKLVQNGFRSDFSKDIIFHNTIEQDSSLFINLPLGPKLVFTCIARDVPHKNLKGCVEFCEYLQEMYVHYEIELRLTSSKYNSEKVQIVDISGSSNEQIKQHYKESHFNLLLSLDHSERGNYEGFGLTCLEAANYGVPSIVSCYGGLPENVHHGLNGLVLDNQFKGDLSPYFGTDKSNAYGQLRASTFFHNQMSHGENVLDRLWSIL